MKTMQEISTEKGDRIIKTEKGAMLINLRHLFTLCFPNFWYSDFKLFLFLYSMKDYHEETLFTIKQGFDNLGIHLLHRGSRKRDIMIAYTDGHQKFILEDDNDGNQPT